MKLTYAMTLLVSFIFASDQIPGPPQDHPIIFTGATIHTVSHGVLENAEILFDGGKIRMTMNLPFPFQYFYKGIQL